MVKGWKGIFNNKWNCIFIASTFGIIAAMAALGFMHAPNLAIMHNTQFVLAYVSCNYFSCI